MEEAPKGTFDDELEWCIHQLETGLLRQNPTPRQVSDASRVLKVLRSRKAPFVKKRQIMNQVFGNYRQKMAQERETQEKAATTSDIQIQEVNARELGSVAYRKCSRDTTGSTANWFPVPSNIVCPNEMVQVEQGGCEATKHDGLCKDDVGSGSGNKGICTSEKSEFLFNFQIPTEEEPPSQSTSNIVNTSEKSEFTFNFQIPEEEPNSQSTEVPGQILGQESVAVNSGLASHINNEEVAEQKVTLQSHKDSKAIKNTKEAITANNDVNQDKAEEGLVLSPKKKKKKGSQGKSLGTTAPTPKNKVEKNEAQKNSNSHQEELQTGADELQRELDWCIEQLELGLQRQKSTPKQVDEALRAIKTLRSEKAALVKKRQIMRAMFGDYRRKMEEEKQKHLRLMQTAAKSARMHEVAASVRRNSSKVYRPSIQNSHRNLDQSTSTVSSSHVSSGDPGTSHQELFVLRSSQEPFCFNFF
ncbi:UPF0488 protein C8orf33 homolog isoform X2 [Bombina bombina]|uniref:UPF0488 protein C8orf33 homolog isoform X2 n=1 Tax=Bombina bombina TaxID=8345 RepID=UPI00235A68F3|nr:UPF0488 protein C8orf33 homolog isoform X2 [Bombina bombina]XP_053551283.1 UPF0488 protein C8orf33 homolog isoform X2 [Bombina bombina]